MLGAVSLGAMTSWTTIGIAILALFAGVSLLALFPRRVGNSREETGTLLLMATVLVVVFLGVILFIDRLGLNSGQRWWALRVSFVGLSLVLWRTGNRMLGRSLR